MPATILAQCYKSACFEEIQALKPGNVHIFADGHGMTVADFINSAEVTAPLLCDLGLSLGERILSSVEATQAAVNCNTNLGIILLCAPLVQAAIHSASSDFRERLKHVLANTTIEDAELCFRAIALANPAGLGKSEQYDVHQPAQVTLQAAMQFAAMNDLIASQYSNAFADVLELGVPHYHRAIARWQNASWATSYVYLCFMANNTDSHLIRKFGQILASNVQREAQQHLIDFAALENPRHYFGRLIHWDTDLKGRGFNPGTSADLTLATLFAIKIIENEE